MSSVRRILVVDDDPYTRDLAGTALRGQGYEVVGAARLTQGLEAARAQRPHLILADVVLPDGSGVELARALRAELPAPEVPIIILMSAFSKGRLADQRRMKEEARAVAFLTKPVSLPALIELVQQHLPVGGKPAPAAPPDAETDRLMQPIEPAPPEPDRPAADAPPSQPPVARPAAAAGRPARAAGAGPGAPARAPRAPAPVATASESAPAAGLDDADLDPFAATAAALAPEAPVRAGPAVQPDAARRAPGPPAGRATAPKAAPAPPAVPEPTPTQNLVMVLANAWRKGWTGTLRVSRPSAEKSFVIEKGQIVWATTSLTDERLGRVMLRLGFLPRDQYESSLKDAAQSGRRLGEVLVARGYLTDWQLGDALVQQMEAIVLGALGWPEGTYTVAAAAGRPEIDDRIVLSPVPRLVLRAFSEVVSADRLEARLAAVGEQLLARRSEVPPAAVAQLAPALEETRLLDALATPTTLDRVLAAHPAGPDVAAPYLAALLALGIVGPATPAGRPPAPEAAPPRRPEPAPALPPAPAPAAPSRAATAAERQAAEEAARRLLEAEAAFEAGRGAVENGDLPAAAEALARAMALCPDEGEYRAWAAWVRALEARAAFDATLDAIAREMEQAAGLSPASEGIYGLIDQVVRLRMHARGTAPE